MSEPVDATPVAPQTEAPAAQTTATPATAKGLQDADYNPREISAFDFNALKQSIKEFGDLSCVVRNRTTGNLVGGHRRKDAFVDLGDAAIVITQEYPSPNHVGTVAEGYIDYQGERFKYREVAWELQWEMAANVAANKIQGKFDQEMLARVMANIEADIRNLTGHTEEQIKDLLQLSSSPEIDLANDPKGDYEQQTYTLHTEQAEVVAEAVALAKTLYNFSGEVNENSNGNAIYYIARAWLDAQKAPVAAPTPTAPVIEELVPQPAAGGPTPDEFS